MCVVVSERVSGIYLISAKFVCLSWNINLKFVILMKNANFGFVISIQILLKCFKELLFDVFVSINIKITQKLQQNLQQNLPALLVIFQFYKASLCLLILITFHPKINVPLSSYNFYRVT